MFILYLLIALLATFIGSMTGMGGGIIMKPIMDALSHFDSASINILSSVTVFAMSLVSVIKRFTGKGKGAPLPFSVSRLLFLTAGSVGGGYLGQLIFDTVQRSLPAIKGVQNALMLILVIFIFFYMLFKERLPRLNFKSIPAFLLAGVFMGVLSSFLGIGGGPVNVALLTFLFGMGIKDAVFTSLLSVLFTQTSKLITVLVTTGFAVFELSMLPFTVIGGIIGATVGAALGKRLSPKATSLLFCIVQILIFAICLYNIF